MTAKATRVMGLGVGAFMQATLQTLKDDGAEVCAFLTRDYGHYAPSLAGPVFHPMQYPDPWKLIRDRNIDFLIPMSIDWAREPWANFILDYQIPILSPVGDGIQIERDRGFASGLCLDHGIPTAQAFVASNRLEAESLAKTHRRPFVLKNPLCAPDSPIHTIVCESPEDTQSWLGRLDYAEGVFMQEYLGTAEIGHIVLVSAGRIHSLATNQEYKRSHTGNLGIVAGGPLGGVVQADPEDQYGLARQLIHPLTPWLEKVNYHGPLQVTAVLHQGTWKMIEYNIRLGITSGPMILKLLKNPVDVLIKTCRNEPVQPEFHNRFAFGCSVSLAGYGYPYSLSHPPRLPVHVESEPRADVWWQQVESDSDGRLWCDGSRVAEICAYGTTLEEAVERAYADIRKIKSPGSYYRTDIGQCLWPPGTGAE